MIIKKKLLHHSHPPDCFKFLWGQVLLSSSSPEASGKEVADHGLVDIRSRASILATARIWLLTSCRGLRRNLSLLAEVACRFWKVSSTKLQWSLARWAWKTTSCCCSCLV